MNLKILARVCAAVIAITLVAFWLTCRGSTHVSSPRISMQQSAEIAIPAPLAVPAPSNAVKDNRRRTAQELADEMNRKVSAQGGPLQVWKNQLNAVESEAKSIRDIKLNSINKLFFKKVEKSLYEWEPLVDVKDAEIASFLEAKQACLVFTKNYSLSKPAKAAFYNGIAYFAPSPTRRLGRPPQENEAAVSIPDNFSIGWAIKLNEKKRIILYKWDFNELPPEDGIIGIETEWE